MKPAISLLTICGLEELESHSGRGVSHVLSIIDPGWADPDVFDRYGPHHRTVFRFHDAIEPEPHIILPQRRDVEAILGFGREMNPSQLGDAHLLIHCHMGISRSSAAMTMLLARAHPEEEADEIVDHIRKIRPIAWPNLRMITFADDLLGREGKLIAAVGKLYAKGLAERPDFAESMARINRAREVELGRTYLPAL
jgi:predicted protein tyrosine phosphatase